MVGVTDIPTTRKSTWMAPWIRAWLIAIRPWSLTASLVPVCVTGALLHEAGKGISLYDWNFVASFVVVLAFHSAANLFNTYYDFKSGADKRETADDRALVDGNVTADSVWSSALGFLGGGLVAALYLMLTAGEAVLYVAIPAAALAVFYTADPLSLKAQGLGDVVIFLMFGPMLAAGVCLATVQELPLQPEDAKAGLRTVAMILGKEGSLQYHKALVGGAYATVLVLMCLCGTPLRQAYVTLCVPWALYLTRRFDAGAFTELPQAVAQHNLLFGVILTAALSEPLFVARVLLACLYYLGGFNNILCWEYNVALSTMKLRNVVPGLSTPICIACFGFAVAGQLVAMMMARLLLAFVIPVTFLVHDLWTVEEERPVHGLSAASGVIDETAGNVSSDESDKEIKKATKSKVVADRIIPNFPSEFDNEFVHFFKNVGMIGGLVMYLEMQQ
eukprot:gene2784-29664_t